MGMVGTVTQILRSHAMQWLISGVLPLPILAVVDPSSSAFLACIYLGLGCGWLSAEIYLDSGFPMSMHSWGEKMLAISAAVAANTAIFILFGTLGDVHTAVPFPLMATLSTVPSIGVIPWMVRKVHHPVKAIIFGSTLLLAAKLTACVVARIKYGAHFVEDGYVAGDWNTAKLMISLFWSLSTMLSLALFWAERRRVSSVAQQVCQMATGEVK